MVPNRLAAFHTAGTIPDWTSWAFIKDVAYHAYLWYVLRLFKLVASSQHAQWWSTYSQKTTSQWQKAKALAKPSGIQLRSLQRDATKCDSPSMSLGMAIGGQLIIEIIFNYPGLGSVLFCIAINARDYQVLQGQLLYHDAIHAVLLT